MENIAYFMQTTQKAGLKLNWTLKALHKNADMDAVLLSLIDLSNHIKQNNNEGFKGPFLELGSSTATTTTTTTSAASSDNSSSTSSPASVGTSSPQVKTSVPEPTTPKVIKKTSNNVTPGTDSNVDSPPTITSSSNGGVQSRLKRFFGGGSNESKTNETKSEQTPSPPVTSNISTTSATTTPTKQSTIPSVTSTPPVSNTSSTPSSTNSTPVRTSSATSVTTPQNSSSRNLLSSPASSSSLTGSSPRRSIGGNSDDDDDDEDEEVMDEEILTHVKKLKESVENPTPEYLRVLNQKLEAKSLKWCNKFANDKGAFYLGEIIITTNKKYKGANEKSIQEQALNCLNTLIDVGALNGIIKYTSIVFAIVMLTDNKESLKTRVMALELLSLICTFNEQGFWVVLEAFGQCKVEKREPKRFFDIVDGLKNEKDEKFKAFCLLLFNSLINTPQDTSIRILLRNELKSLGLDDIVTKLQKDVDSDTIKEESLKDQIRAFDEEMMSRFIENDDDEDEEEESNSSLIDTKSIKDPLQLMKLLTIKLGGSSVGISNLRNILQHLLEYTQIIPHEMDDINKSDKILQDSWKNIDNMLHALTNDSIMTKNVVADVIKSEKMLKILLQKGNKKSKELDQEVENLKKENDALKRGVKYEPEITLPSGSGDAKPTTEVAMLTKLVKQQKEKLEAMKISLEDLEKQNIDLLRNIKEKDAAIESFRSTGVMPTNVTTSTEGVPPIPSGGDSSLIPPPPIGGDVPPPPGMGIPPPPGSSGVPPPPGGVPPPPGGGVPLPPGVPKTPEIKLPDLPKRSSKKPLRNFYGDPIRKQKVGTTAWVKDGIAERTKDIDIDPNELEDLFSNVPKEKESTKKERKIKELVSFIDPQKSNNLSILLGYLRLDNEDIKNAIIDMDDEILSQQNIESLKDKAPTEEEIQSIMAYTGDKDLLAPADKFYLAIKDVPRLAGRLSCWAFKYKFESSIPVVIPDLETVLFASQEVQRSKKFKELLTVILAIANFLNANSSKKDSYGFTLSSLSKLKDTKAVDGKTTLLQYIGIFCTKKNQNVLRIREDFGNLEMATRVSFPETLSEISKLKAGVEEIEKELNRPEWKNNKNDKFYKIMSEFLENAKGDMRVVNILTGKIELSLKTLADLYAEDEKILTKNPTEFFMQIFTFLESFLSSLEDYLRQRILERRKREKREKQRQLELRKMQQRKQMELEALKKKKQQETSPAAAGGELTPESGEKRNIKQAIRQRKQSMMSGEAFRDKRESRMAVKQQQESSSLPFPVNLRKTKSEAVEQ
ncbi:diaphanous-related formin [Naegleria gruberi]|uniref:Diaphanous-related formin n=1 Tax=Naegleria gruberi TaxID=5762 RepID=D2VH52_NAEGR|nr:diaphanous-related formin [Naegleria gruberi]EFC43832.1 diaphanous-related formin [Naegleria gruberi]|eukprot:XP_002676576.1 diaphanous-related formin [Naegleria gruberi strain NEG-M]